LGIAELLHVSLKYACCRIASNFRSDRIGDRRFEGLVMDRERAITHHVAGEQAGRSLRVHDEGTDNSRLRSHRSNVRHVIASPLRPVPPHELFAWIPRAAVGIGRRAIIENASIGWPGPGPFGKDAD